MNIKDIVVGKVVDFSHEGKAILKEDGLVIFSDSGVIGDEIKVEIKKVKKNFAEAKTLEILSFSEDRSKLDFEVRESLGGIPLVHYAYDKQLEWKEEKVKKDLEKFTGLSDIKVNKIMGMEDSFKYRNNVQIPVRSFRGRNYIGFYELGSKNIIDMEETILQSDAGNQALKAIRKWISDHKMLGYDGREKKGNLKHIGIRTNYKDEVMVIIVTRTKRLNHLEDLIEILKEKNVVSLYQNVQPVDSALVYGPNYIKLFGDDKLEDEIGKYKFELSANSFFQVNRKQAASLYAKGIDYLDLNKDDVLYDLYSGIGTISIIASEYANSVYGIESVRAAVVDGEENLTLNKIDNVEFIYGRVEDVLSEAVKDTKKPNKLILDPPRSGCEKVVLDEILKLDLEKIVYISCNPTTLARDVKILLDGGYKIEEVQPVDMFGHTAHVETVVLMSRVEK